MEKKKENLIENLVVDIWYNKFQQYDAAKKYKYGFGIFLDFEDQEPTVYRQFAKGATEFKNSIETISKFKTLPFSIRLVEYTDNKPDAAEVTSQTIKLDGTEVIKKKKKKAGSLGEITEEIKEQITKELRRDLEHEKLQNELQAAKKTIAELEKEIETNEKELETYYAKENEEARTENWGKTAGNLLNGLSQALPGIKTWAESKGLGVIFNGSGAIDQAPAGMGPQNTATSPADKQFIEGLTAWFKSLTQQQCNKVRALLAKLTDDLTLSEDSLDAAIKAVGIDDYIEYLKKITTP